VQLRLVLVELLEQSLAGRNRSDVETDFET
jgi:hypothetical protein